MAAKVIKRGVVGVVGANSRGYLGSTPRANGPEWRKGIATLFFFFNKQEYLELFKYLTNPLGICSPPVPYISSYYKKESHGNGPKMLAKGFEPRIS